MAGIPCIALTAPVTLVAATAQTTLQITAPTNQRLKLKRWCVSFNGISPIAEPVVVSLARQTTAGTSATTITPVSLIPVSETLQATAKSGFSAEPTAGDVLDRIECHPQSPYDVWRPLGDEYVVPGGGRVGIVCTAPAGVNVVTKIEYEE